jgi:hypothetical protein
MLLIDTIYVDTTHLMGVTDCESYARSIVMDWCQLYPVISIRIDQNVLN